MAFTRNQAKYILKNCSHLVGKEVRQGVPITDIIVLVHNVPSDTFLEAYLNKTITALDIAELYGIGQILLVFGANLSRPDLLPEVPHVNIETLLSDPELEEILNRQ